MKKLLILSLCFGVASTSFGQVAGIIRNALTTNSATGTPSANTVPMWNGIAWVYTGTNSLSAVTNAIINNNGVGTNTTLYGTITFGAGSGISGQVVLNTNVVTTGGNTRGSQSMDFQLARTSVDRVASGDQSTLLAGSNSAARGRFSVAFGWNNQAHGRSSFVGGSGSQGSNDVTADGTANFTFAIDSFNNGDRSVILGGKDNWINAATGGSATNNPSAFDSNLILGGYENYITKWPNAYSGSMGFNTLLGSYGIDLDNSEAIFVVGAKTSIITNSSYGWIFGGGDNRLSAITNQMLMGWRLTNAFSDGTQHGIRIGYYDKGLALRSNGNLTLFGSQIISGGLTSTGQVAFYSGLDIDGDIISQGNIDASFGAVYAGTLNLPGATASRPAFIDGSGNVVAASGTPDGTKFLRDDGVLAVPPGGVGSVSDTGVNPLGSNTVYTGTSGTITLYGTNQHYVTYPSGTVTFEDNNLLSNIVYSVTVSNAANTVNWPGSWRWLDGETVSGVPLIQNGQYIISFKRDRSGTNAWVVAGKTYSFTNGWGTVLTTNGTAVSVNLTNYPISIATNAISIPIDFSQNVQQYNAWYHLTNRLSLWPTNHTPGRTVCIYFDTNLVTFDVTVTNLAGTPVNWNMNVTTNGAVSFVKTNTVRAKVYLTAETNGTYTAEMGYYR